MAHITGGGLAENFARVLPEGIGARLDQRAWRRPPVFDWLAAAGQVADGEMARTFNNGIGFCVVVPADQADTAIETLRAAGETVVTLGELCARADEQPAVVFSS